MCVCVVTSVRCAAHVAMCALRARARVRSDVRRSLCVSCVTCLCASVFDRVVHIRCPPLAWNFVLVFGARDLSSLVLMYMKILSHTVSFTAY